MKKLRLVAQINLKIKISAFAIRKSRLKKQIKLFVILKIISANCKDRISELIYLMFVGGF